MANLMKHILTSSSAYKQEQDDTGMKNHMKYKEQMVGVKESKREREREIERVNKKSLEIINNLVCMEYTFNLNPLPMRAL